MKNMANINNMENVNMENINDMANINKMENLILVIRNLDTRPNLVLQIIFFSLPELIIYSIIKAPIHYAIFHATVSSNSWREPTRNLHPVGSAFKWFPPTVCRKVAQCIKAFRKRRDKCTLSRNQMHSGAGKKRTSFNSILCT